MAGYQLSILTPQGESFNGTVEALSAQGQMGGFGVLAGHAAIVYSLARGILKITAANKNLFFAHQSGILEVKPDHNVLILVDEAVDAANLADAQTKLTALTAV